MKTLTAMALALVLGVSASAAAQPAAEPSKGAATSGTEDGASYKAKTVFDFEDDMVEGDLQRPDGELVSSVNAVKHDSLIEIRRDFIPEMLKSLEDI